MLSSRAFVGSGAILSPSVPGLERPPFPVPLKAEWDEGLERNITTGLKHAPQRITELRAEKTIQPNYPRPNNSSCANSHS